MTSHLLGAMIRHRNEPGHIMTMPFDNESTDDYLARCARAAGEFSPRATPEQIESLKAQGYAVEVWPVAAETISGADIDQPDFHIEAHNLFTWHHRASGDFQETEPSFEEADSWALALIHSKGL